MRAALPLHTHGRIAGGSGVEILKVLSPEEAAGGCWPAEDVLVQEPAVGGASMLRRATGLPITIDRLRDPAVIQPGDVVRLLEGTSLISVLFRRGSTSNTLFATERCNSLCLMCSQPPRDEDDSWRVAELIRLVTLIDKDEIQLGITGGEPTLLEEGLERILEACAEHLPETTLHILTNGRNFADRTRVGRLARIRPDHTVWAIPLYADVPDLHDEVVAAPGAFEETLQGFYELGRVGARTELRVVLHKLTIPRLPQLASFIYRRLPFVQHVALMGLEPMGFAKGNRETLWIDPVDYIPELESAVFHLSNRSIPVSIYSLPHCILPRNLWPFARQSISAWKRLYPDACEPCAVGDLCAGFFASAGPAWRSRAVHPLTTEELAA